MSTLAERREARITMERLRDPPSHMSDHRLRHQGANAIEQLLALEDKGAQEPALESASRDMLSALRKVFVLLNAYARKEDLAAVGATSPFGVLGQVYGDLAAHFAAFSEAVEATRPPTEEEK